MVPETLITSAGVTAFPQPRDPVTAALLARARDHLAANVMWGYLLETARAGLPVTLTMVHDVAEGIRAGDLPDRAFAGSWSLLSPV